MFKLLSLLLVIVCFATYTNVNGRTLSKRSSPEAPWVPDGMSLDEWYRCRGFPCDQWERTQEKLMVVKAISSQEDQTEALAMDQINDLIEKYNITRADDSLDGCIWLTEDQLDAILEEKGLTNQEEEQNSDHVIHKRQVYHGVASGGFAKWPMPVHFRFDGEHTENEANYIRRAVAHIEEQTCVDFEEVDTGSPFYDSHIVVTRRSTGCHSYVGRIGLNGQQLNLQPGCIFAFGIPVHEFLHALGIWHEMQREDRDEHIDVLWNNIQHYRSQFYTQPSATLGTEYDPSSVMHYAGKDGAVNGRNSMETKNPLYQRNMGQRTGLSFRDAQLINKAYCDDKCTTPLPQPCQRGGYQDPKDCSKCRCPPGFSGTYCEQLAPSNAECGGEIALNSDGSEVTIKSPGYETLGYYREFQECNWRFTAPAGHKVSLRFEDEFGVYCGFRDACFHWVEVQYEAGKNTQGPRFCCNDRPDVTIESEWDEMTVLFRSDYSPVGSFSRRGFRAVIHAVPDSEATPPPTQTTQSTEATTTTTSTTTPTTTTPVVPVTEECVKIDLAIALDSSGSVGSTNWQKLLRFTHTLLKPFRISPSCTRVALVTFGTYGYLESNLDQHVTKAEVVDVMYRMRFRDQSTNIAGALEVLAEDVFGGEEMGDRADAMNVAIIVADGPANRDEERTIPNAERARAQSIELFTVGVGSGVNEAELEAITNDVTRNIYVGDFDSLLEQEFVDALFERIMDLENGDNNESNENEEDNSNEETDDFSWLCSFEIQNGDPTWCDVTQSRNDDFDWTRREGATPSDPTGPDSAHSGRYYVYIEATGRAPNDKARLELPTVPHSSHYCLSFAYHMFGYHINTLSLEIQDPNGQRTVTWSDRGQKGNFWLDANVDVAMEAGDRLVFVGERGEAYSGDIGLDSIELRSGSC